MFSGTPALTFLAKLLRRSIFMLYIPINLCGYHAILNIGPATDKEFFYDVKLENNVQISAADFKDLLSVVQGIVKQKQPFQRIEVSPAEAASIFGVRHRFICE